MKQVSLPRRLTDAGKQVLKAHRLVTSRARVLPDFIIIGAQRAGTTSLYNYLVQQPSVMEAHTKEVHYFDTGYKYGLWWYRAHFPMRRTIAAAGESVLTGEASPYYIFHPRVAGRVARSIPHVKLIALLRNPVDRAYSHYQHEVRLGLEDLSFAGAIHAEPARLRGEHERLLTEPNFNSFALQHYSYLSRGEYAQQLEGWFEHFPREQFLILNSEDFYANPEAAVETTARFLGLPSLQPREYRKYNEGGYAEGMDPSLRAELVQHFEPHNGRLCALLGEDYHWS